MTQKEKAKRYDEAIERARALNNGEDVDVEAGTTICEYIFPKLKESEDERILELIKKYIHYNISDMALNADHITREQLEDWLEKQSKHLENYDEAEKEKADFVGDGFIECHADFLDFKEGKTYWLEYIGDDKYNVRSDTLLGKTYHITPCQLYTVFKKLTWLEKQSKHSILNVPSREVILAIWDLGNEWKELTNGCISTEYGTQLDYIQKHWEESEYYLREKQRGNLVENGYTNNKDKLIKELGQLVMMWQKETLIKKACKWLDANFPKNENIGSYYKKSFIERFKKAMEE